jgi:hypothetical protein
VIEQEKRCSRASSRVAEVTAKFTLATEVVAKNGVLLLDISPKSASPLENNTQRSFPSPTDMDLLPANRGPTSGKPWWRGTFNGKHQNLVKGQVSTGPTLHTYFPLFMRLLTSASENRRRIVVLQHIDEYSYEAAVEMT